MENSTAVVISGGAAIVGGLLGGVLSGVYNHLRDGREQPKLLIDYAGGDANRVEVELASGISEIYVRARVRNTGVRVARNCLVFLTALKEVHPSGTTPTTLHDAMPLAWAGWNFTPRDVPQGVEFYVDLMRVSKQTTGWQISVQQLYASHANLKQYSGTYRFQLTVTADNAFPATCEIDVTYDQNWRNLRALATQSK